jgi:hypothetical protein
VVAFEAHDVLKTIGARRYEAGKQRRSVDYQLGVFFKHICPLHIFTYNHAFVPLGCRVCFVNCRNMLPKVRKIKGVHKASPPIDKRK